MKCNKTECLKSLGYACFNPPPAHRVVNGDIAYLHIRTLENQTFFVTCNSLGFYVNKCQVETANQEIKRVFDPLPQENRHFSVTLVGLLKDISPLFDINFKLILEQNDLDIYENNFVYIRPNWQGLKSEPQTSLLAEEEFAYDLFGYDISSMRD